ncbi:AAA family ATPase [Actinokineospora sp. PR83]|uniref:McrB family protein n=1 Tax=Actinokineospora sp. PR83 TaxID=2884908 RepID=UPI001F16BB56|nr:AAA family ATPase [Actinokineospora sp. PR83]MCG8918409.1 AAA family ATPase [Actinokineospora sp. PR83]
MATTRIPFPSARPVYHAVERWRDHCLLADGTLFPETGLFADDDIATLANGEALIGDYVEQPDTGRGDFLTKLHGQLAESPSGTVRLAAELLYVHLLIARSSAVGGQRKLELVNSVLHMAGFTAKIPKDLAAALDSGLINPGQGFNSLRWRQFAYLVEVFTAIKRLPRAERTATLTDPDAFVAFLDGIDDQSAWIQRYSLEHLLFPDTFQPVVSRDHRRAILQRWPTTGGSESRRLAAVSDSLAPNTVWADQGFVNLYRAPHVWEWGAIGERWRTLSAWAGRLLETPVVEAERADKVAAAAALRQVREGIAQGSTTWLDDLRKAFKQANVVGWRDSDTFLAWLADESPQVLQELWTDPGPESIDRFRARVPKAAAATTGAFLSIAAFLLSAVDVTGFPPWRAMAVSSALTRVGAAKPEPSATDGERYLVFLVFLDQVRDLLARSGKPLADRLDAQGLVWALVNHNPPADWSHTLAEGFLAWRDGKKTAVDPTQEEILVVPRTTVDAVTVAVEPEHDLADLAAELYLDQEFLDEINVLLKDRGQVVFQGPPGTGKTYVARELAKWFTGSPDRVHLVQFHASYSYEDFVEGYRPRESGGFVRVEGPLLRLAEQARAHQDERFVLIVDELNRANVARVFGELYFLLEYRKEPARLLYGDTDFTLPPNLYIIATMNTADRSVALLDSALRRRFYFVDFLPTTAPVSGVLRRYLADHHPQLGWVAEVVDQANKQLDDPAVAIGPSHFLRPDLSEQWVRRAWKHAVLPVLAEHFHGMPGRLAEFDLDRLREEVDPAGADAVAAGAQED